MKVPSCPICKSENVLLDSYARFNREKNSYELHEVFTDAICEDCEAIFKHY